MNKEQAEMVKKVKDIISKENFSQGNIGHFYLSPKGEVSNKRLGTPCCAELGRAMKVAYPDAKYLFITGNIDKMKTYKHAQKFAEWALGPDSYYAKIIEAFPFFTIIRQDGKIVGALLDPGNVNHKLYFNFTKMFRSFSEHQNRLPMWDMLVERGVDPKLAYLLMYWFNTKGDLYNSGHAPIEAKQVSLEQFYNKNHTNWDSFLKTKGPDGSGGENNKTHASGKSPKFTYTDIPRKGVSTLKTYFISKYEKKEMKSSSRTIEELVEFGKNVEKVHQEFLKEKAA